MKTNRKLSTKIITIFIVIFLSSLSVTTAQNNGPVSPEAVAFEPVDATDMVNLVTGNMSYVIPLLNVPSPEGGYPIALSYHAGIAMEQEASWVGLGWNINVGTLTRSVNGYPDDWKQGVITEFFYDEGGTESYYTASIGVSTGVFEAGLTYSWGDNMASQGSVYFGGSGIGVTVGTNGVSAYASTSIGLGKDSPLSITASIGTESASIGLRLKGDKGLLENGATLSLSVNIPYTENPSVNLSYSLGEKSKYASVGINFSSNGLSINAENINYNIGNKLSNETSISMSSYVVSKSGYYIPIYIGVGNIAITASFGKQKIEYHLNITNLSKVSGPMYFDEYGASFVYNNSYINDIDAFMDIKEVGISGELKLDENNIRIPNYDNFRVNAQGLSGTVSPKLNKSGSLIGLSKYVRESNGTINEFGTTYRLPVQGSYASYFTDFSDNFNFYLANEYSSSLLIDPVDFDIAASAPTTYDFINEPNLPNVQIKKRGNFIEAYTNSDLRDVNSEAYQNGFLKANETIDYLGYNGLLVDPAFVSDGIGAFKITTPDGKTYHYSLPVYNFEIVTRTFGMVPARPIQTQAHFDKRQTKKYATHWLLTAITGPNYIDMNNNHVADENDYGYWTSFDYGKWSDGYIWYAPHKEEANGFDVDETNPDIKSYTWGRKDIYYLDKVKTRTHTALFVKEERDDAKGKQLDYTYRKYGAIETTFNLQSQSTLRLKEILLLKNEDDITNKTNVENLNSLPLGSNNNSNDASSYSIYFPTNDWSYSEGAERKLRYSLQTNVLDRGDLTSSDWSTLKNKALKIIDFSSHYDYSLAKNSPFSQATSSGRLTLNGLTFKGKKEVQLTPSYKFSYKNISNYNIDKKDDWGYYEDYPDNWSLNEIINPTGGKIQIEYEEDDFYAAVGHEVKFETLYLNNPANGWILSTEGVVIGSVDGVEITTGDPITITTSIYTVGGEISNINYDGHIGEYGTYYTWPEENPVTGYNIVADETLPWCAFKYFIGSCPTYITYKINHPLKGGGIRVNEIRTVNNDNLYKTTYNYNKFNSTESSGIVSFIPNSPDLLKEVPYLSELPAPYVMYGNVEMSTFGTNNVSLSTNRYKFKTLEFKENDNIKFGDAFEIVENDLGTTINTNNIPVNIKQLKIINNLSTLGQLLEISVYNNKEQLLQKTVNNYKTLDQIMQDNQGVNQESFQTYKDIDYGSSSTNQDKWLINSSTKLEYVSVLESATISQGGFTSTTYFDKHDYNTGQLLETHTFTSDGTLVKTKTIPAYTISQYSGTTGGYGMGSKVDNITNKNMLSQQAASYTYLLDESNGSEKIVSASITTWNNDWKYRDHAGVESSPMLDNEKIWRKHKSYIWKGDITQEGFFNGFNQNTDDGFNWGLGVTQANDKWKNISTTTRYDHYSMPLEIMDINGNYISTKMADNESKVLTVGNAKYTEMFFSGAEHDEGEGSLYMEQEMRGASLRDDTKAHTGDWSIKANTGDEFGVFMKAGEHNQKRYKLSVWAHKDNYLNARVRAIGTSSVQFNGEEIHAGNWVQLNHYFELPTIDAYPYVTSNSGVVYFDDFRMHPVTSSMTSYVYNEWDELWYLIGANGLATRFEYDAAGRLVKTYTEIVDDDGVTGGFKKVSENRYNYKAQ